MKKRAIQYYIIITALIFLVLGFRELISRFGDGAYESESISQTDLHQEDQAPSKDLPGKEGQDRETASASGISGDGELKVTFIDVGQGLSILLESGGQYLLYDGGECDTATELVSYLSSLRIDEIDYMVASHYDSDHVCGLISVLKNFDVGMVLGPDYSDEYEFQDEFIKAASELHREIVHPEVDEQIRLGSAYITVIAPAELYDDANNNSIVLKVRNGKDTFLLMGDAEYEEEMQIIESGKDVKTDVIVIGHHGSRSSTSQGLLYVADPRYAVISWGQDNPYGHPEQEVMEKLKNLDIDVYRTDIQSTITAVSSGNGISWSQPPCNDYTPGSIPGQRYYSQDPDDAITIDEKPPA